MFLGAASTAAHHWTEHKTVRDFSHHETGAASITQVQTAGHSVPS